MVRDLHPFDVVFMIIIILISQKEICIVYTKILIVFINSSFSKYPLLVSRYSFIRVLVFLTSLNLLMTLITICLLKDPFIFTGFYYGILNLSGFHRYLVYL